MKNLVLSGGMLLGTVASWGGPCPDWPNPGDPAYTYYLQSAVEVVRSGLTNVYENNPVVRNLRNDLADIDTVKYSTRTRYSIPLTFAPNCISASVAPVSSWFKDSLPGSQTFSRVSTPYPRIQFYDSTDPKLASHPEYHQWISFNPIDASTAVYGYLGRPRTPGAPFENWVGVSYLEDSTRGGTGFWTVSNYSYPTLTGPRDSASLDTALIFRNSWHSIPYNANRHTWIYVHTLHLRYDTIAPSPVRRSRASIGTTFSAWQQGASVWIQAGDMAATGEAVELHDMFGRKTAELKPRGSTYAWDGKSLQGGDAPAGIYFVRSKAGVLGRFAYSR